MIRFCCRKVGAIGLGLCLGVTAALGQALDTRRSLTQYVLQNWQQEDGLPQNSVTCITQTRDGYIWLGTYQGLVRFDGVNFEVFTSTTHPELGNNGIWALREADDGSLWIGTNGGGLVRYREGAFTPLTTAQGLSHNTVIAIAQTQQGTLWAGTLEGYSQFDGTQLVPTELPESLARNTIFDICEIAPGELWFATREGLFVSQGGKTPQRVRIGPTEREPFIVTSLLADRTGRVWVGTRNNGIYLYEEGKFRPAPAAWGLAGKTINRLYQDPTGTVWVGLFGGGLYRYLGEGFTKLDADYGLADNDVLSMYYDREGSLWFGTKRGGLQRLKNSKFTNFGPPEGLPSVNTTCVLPAREGGMWIGFNDAGLVYFDPNPNPEKTIVRRYLPGRYIRSVYEADDGRVWFSDYGRGVGYLKGGQVTTFGPAQGLADIFVRAILPGEDGSIWFATRGGLNRYRNGRLEAVRHPGKPKEEALLCMTHGADGLDDLWLGTDGQGVVHYTRGTFTQITQADSLNSGVILSLYYDAAAQGLWVGTNAGLNLVRGGRVHRFVRLGGVFTDAILQIHADAFGELWLSTNNGIYSVSRQALLDFATPGTAIGAIVAPVRYDMADGMRAAECVAATHPGVTATPDGRLWFATIQGITVVNPTQIAKNDIPPPVHVQGMVVDGKFLSPTSGVHLAPGAKVLEIRYAGLSYQVPRKVRFKYRLKGFSEAWIDADNRRSAFFTSLAPGTYTFEVLARNNDEVWSPLPARLEFTLEPYFYQTTWFLLLTSLLGLLAVGLVVRQRERNAQQAKRLLEERVIERTEEVEKQKRMLAVHNDELSQLNTNLNRKTEALHEALISLQRTQDQLVASEKMAVLGQLVANIAHEINTPLSAIMASARNAERVLPVLVPNLTEQLRHLSEAELRTFTHLVEVAAQTRVALSTREERLNRQQAQTQLEHLKTAKPEALAYTLAQLGVWENLARFSNLLFRPDAELYLDLVSQLVGLIQQNVTILQAAQRTGKIVQALKSYAHQDPKGERVPLSLEGSIETVLTLYHSQLKRGIEVERDYETLPDVPVYPDEIEQVWTNLVSNAILAMNGSGTLRISLRLDGAHALALFEDTGAGIPEDVLPHIFEPFFTTRPKGQGSGLGLDICQKIVRKHGGLLEVASQPGHTVFTVRLPLVA
ncbi:MAG: two-component regulator propeller domain-containing protein [Bacteroidia bacterium]|nr:two-component regulator propeller domain-containing protein [Bacteroidia bacterium]